MIELRDVTKAYRTRHGVNVVLYEINAFIGPGECVGILGRNGAGKSTLLRIIGGAEMPDSGEVIRSGRVSWPIGFSGGFNSSLSGEENCRFVARIYSQDVDAVVDDTREFAELGEYFYEPVRTYSSGMRARLAFGLSMAVDFDVYLVDEITAVGDTRFKEKCKQAFHERRERSGLIMVSHQFKTLREFCHRGAIVRNGHLRMHDDIESAIREYKQLEGTPSSSGSQETSNVRAS